MEADGVEHFQAPLAAVAAAAKGTRLRLGPGIGRGAEHRYEVHKVLVYPSTIGSEVERIGLGIRQVGFPIDNTLIGLEAGTLGAYDVDLLSHARAVAGDQGVR